MMVAYLFFRLIYPKIFLAYLQEKKKRKERCQNLHSRTRENYFLWTHFSFFSPTPNYFNATHVPAKSQLLKCLSLGSYITD